MEHTVSSANKLRDKFQSPQRQPGTPADEKKSGFGGGARGLGGGGTGHGRRGAFGT